MVVGRAPDDPVAGDAVADISADAQRTGRRADRTAAGTGSGGNGSRGKSKNKGNRSGGSGRITPELIREQLRLHDASVRDRDRRKRQQDMLDKGFRRRNIATLKEGQDALNIAFGAVLSAYVGNVLAGLNPAHFSQGELAWFFVLIGLFITGLCIGNSGLLKGHRGLGALFLAGSVVAAYLALKVARMLGFEIPILRVMMICWVAALLAGDLVLTGIIYVHHHRSAT